MNLATEPWIPVVWHDGRQGRVSLLDAFTRGREIADLPVRPHERIALYRLLLCVAHAALDGPQDEDNWLNCLTELPARIPTYLTRWRDAFELFGNGQRFLQVAGLENTREDEGEDNAADKLDLALASGNNSTLFDNAGGSNRTFAPAELVRMLVTFQCFSPGGLIGIARWNGQPTAASKLAPPAVCIASSPLHAFVRKPNLLETVHANLITKEEFACLAGRAGTWGEPVWHRMPSRPGDLPEITRSYLGRLVPVARAVRLNEDHRTAIIAKGLDYPAFDEIFAEPSMTLVVEGDGRKVLRADPNRAIWRQLPAITTLRRGNELGGPLALRRVTDAQTFDLWAGALIANKAKLVDAVESVFAHVPGALLREDGHRVYADGVNHAERLAGALNRAIAGYRRRLKDEIERGEGRRRGLNLKTRAALHYWTEAERLVPELFRLVTNPPPVNPRRGSHEFSETPWGRALFQAALAAYDLACPHATPRHMQAYILGRAELLRPAAETEPESQPEEDAP